MDRAKLMDALSTVSPALSNNDRIPILSHLWFRDDHLMAYNDEIAISVPLKVGFTTAVPPTLIRIVGPHNFKEVVLTHRASELHVKIGNTSATLPTLDREDQFIFDMPKVSKPFPAPIKELTECIELCLRSVGQNMINIQNTGVTLIADNKVLKLYATDQKTMTYCQVRLDQDPPSEIKWPVILSEPFCKELIGMKGDIKFEILDDHALASNDRGVVLFGRLIEVDREIPFEKIVAERLPKNYQKALVPIPSARMLLAMQLAINTIRDEAGKLPSTRMECRNAIMSFTTKGQGNLIDKVKIPGQPDIEGFNINCEHIQAGLKPYDKMLATEQGVIMANGKGIYIIARA